MTSFKERKPVFLIGFEFEGLVREGTQREFDTALQRLVRGIDRGTDSSVEGQFEKPSERAGPGCGNGIEIRTNPLPLAQGLKQFDQITEFLREWSRQSDFKTNETCGLHVNVSEKSLVETQKNWLRFYAHLLVNFPERDVLKIFNRSDNTYCQPFFTRRGKLPDPEVLAAKFCTGETLLKDKYQAVGVHPSINAEAVEGDGDDRYVNERRVEFRCLGNKDYHKRHDDLHKALDIIVTSCTKAFDGVYEDEKLKVVARALRLKMKKSNLNVEQALACLA